MTTEERRKSAAARLESVREIVLAHGWNSTVFQLLNPGLEYWISEEVDAVAGYVPYRNWWIVAGAPVAPIERFSRRVAEFETAARHRGARVAYFAAEERLEQLFAGSPGRSRVRLGAQPVYDPRIWDAALAGHASLRAQLHRARNKAVVVREWPAARAANDPALRRCLEEWLERRGLPPLLFLTTPWTLDRLADRRVFVAEREGIAVGFLVSSPVPLRRWVLIEQIVRGSAAPNGVAELMIDAAFRALVTEADRITLGLAPLSELGAPDDGEAAPGWLRPWIAWAGVHGRRFYNFRGLESFKAKLGPVAWEPVWLISDTPRIGVGVLWATLAAFAGGKPASFAFRALARALRRDLARLGGRVAGSLCGPLRDP
ncbi:MAG: phosphatidylglycerol lysyltransferase domain-containing protein [Thermoanaerobaculia bacterium]